jgi:hypothetical protein
MRRQLFNVSVIAAVMGVTAGVLFYALPHSVERVSEPHSVERIEAPAPVTAPAEATEHPAVETRKPVKRGTRKGDRGKPSVHHGIPHKREPGDDIANELNRQSAL